MAPGAMLTKDELYEADFPWTIIDGSVYAIGDFLAVHPGGPIISRAVGEDASELFHVHHNSKRAFATLCRYEIGHLIGSNKKERSFQKLLNERIGRLAKKSERPIAEVVALTSLCVFFIWSWFAFVKGWWLSNVALTWFWWRHLDSGLHSAIHGQFRYSSKLQQGLLQVYSVLSHHTLGYYYGESALNGMGMSKHFWHHIHTNDPREDPDWVSMSSDAWVRRHRSSRWSPFHKWQCWYWLAVTATLEPILELLSMAKTCIDAFGALLEPPTDVAGSFGRRLCTAAALFTEVAIGPGYQGIAFICQPWWKALGVLLLARAIARLVLFPFAEVQHYMPEHMPEQFPQGAQEEWAITQLRTTANLKLSNPVAYVLDFLMFHGDSYQVEHHLWPAMSFLNFRKASQVVKNACAEFGIPYHEIGYWEGYAKIRSQVCAHSMPESPKKRMAETSLTDDGGAPLLKMPRRVAE